MFDPLLDQPSVNTAGFGEVSEVNEERAVGASAHEQSKTETLIKSHGAREGHYKSRRQKPCSPVVQHVTGLLLFRLVIFIQHVCVPPTDRNPRHINALTLQRMYLPPNECVADLWVLIDQISDAHISLVFDELGSSCDQPV